MQRRQYSWNSGLSVPTYVPPSICSIISIRSLNGHITYTETQSWSLQLFFESLFKADTSLKRTPVLILIVLHSYSLTLETEISLKQTSSLISSPELSVQQRADCIFLSCVANSSRKPLDPTRNFHLYWHIETGQSEAGTGPSPMPI